MEAIIKEILKVQNNFISLNSSSKFNAEATINTMKQQLEASLGASISQEIGGVLDSTKVLFEDSFNQLRSRIDELEKNLMNAIKDK